MAQQALMLLVALLILAFGAVARRPSAAWPWSAGLLAGLLLLAPWPFSVPAQPLVYVDASQAGLLLALLALARLRARWFGPRLTLLAGGLLGGLWLQVLAGLGYPPLLQWSFLAVLMPAAIACSLWHPPYRAPQPLEDALLITLAGGLALALLPGLGAGWRSAQGLQQQDLAAVPAVAAEPWSFVVVALCLVLGAVRGLWRYRRRALRSD
jgi:hypothetical protein